MPTDKSKEASSHSPKYVMSASTSFLLVTFIAASSLALLSGMAVSHIYHDSMHNLPIGSGLQQTNDMELSAFNVDTLDSTLGEYGNINEEEEEDDEEEDDEEEDDEDEDDEDDGIELTHVPGSGQQAFVEIRGSDRSFLLDQDRLIDAMLSVVERSSLSVLSYHCTNDNNNEKKNTKSMKGLNCICLLSEASHISFQTWFGDANAVEKEDSITIDILVSGSKQFQVLEDLLPSIKNAFAIEAAGRSLPKMWWTNRQRNFAKMDGYPRSIMDEDLGGEYFYSFYLKNKVATTTSIFQQIDIWDIVNSKATNRNSHTRSLLANDSTYESTHPEHFEADRVIFLDGVMQSTGRGNEAYHEALVQPAMFAHDGPRRVAIIGGGEGATLKEVLKHSTVEKVKMIEIDEIMVNVSRDNLPAWNQCGGMEGSTLSCFDDPRADIHYEDALAWFINRFSSDVWDTDNDAKGIMPEEKFDLLISDALDPQDTVEFANVLYQNDAYLKSLYNALNDDGVAVFQLGRTNDLSDVPEIESENKNRQIMKEKITELGFQSLHIYTEDHCGFESPWLFLVACKSSNCRSNWYASPAKVNQQIHKRIIRPSASSSDTSLLKYFDGATMSRYHYPPKAVETVYCRETPTPEDCKLGSNDMNFHLPIFVEGSITNPTTMNSAVPLLDQGTKPHQQHNGSFVMLQEDIPMWSYIKPGDTIHVPEQSAKTIHSTGVFDEYDSLGALSSYFKASRGIYSSVLGISDLRSEIRSSINNSTNSQGVEFHNISLSVNILQDGKDIAQLSSESPLIARHLPHYESGFLLRDIWMGK